MNLSRLLVLGSLDRLGPLHGHRIRRAAEQSDVSEWGGVSIGALYRELRLLKEEGLIAALRREQAGRRPTRTIYRIAAAGRRRLAAMREEALTGRHQGPDAVAVALLFGGAGGGAVAPLLRTRRDRLARERDGIAAERVHHLAAGRIGPLEVAVFRRGELLRDAEVRWIDEALPAFASAATPAPARARRRKAR